MFMTGVLCTVCGAQVYLNWYDYHNGYFVFSAPYNLEAVIHVSVKIDHKILYFYYSKEFYQRPPLVSSFQVMNNWGDIDTSTMQLWVM